MSEQKRQEFDDPVLRSALKRACGGQTAPAALRRRVEALATDGAAWAISVRRWRYPLGGLAAAAVLLVSVALTFNFSRDQGTEGIGAGAVLAGPVSVQLISEVIAKHDSCQDVPHHHFQPGKPEGDFQTIQHTLGHELGHPVMAGCLERAGWHFEGAKICRVGKSPAAHLIYSRDGQCVSVYSLPAHRWKGKPGAVEGTFKKRPYVIFKTADGVYCLVGNCRRGGLTVADLQSLRAVLASLD